jgi:hypothetical protein
MKKGNRGQALPVLRTWLNDNTANSGDSGHLPAAQSRTSQLELKTR